MRKSMLMLIALVALWSMETAGGGLEDTVRIHGALGFNDTFSFEMVVVVGAVICTVFRESRSNGAFVRTACIAKPTEIIVFVWSSSQDT